MVKTELPRAIWTPGVSLNNAFTSIYLKSKFDLLHFITTWKMIASLSCWIRAKSFQFLCISAEKKPLPLTQEYCRSISVREYVRCGWWEEQVQFSHSSIFEIKKSQGQSWLSGKGFQSLHKWNSVSEWIEIVPKLLSLEVYERPRDAEINSALVSVSSFLLTLSFQVFFSWGFVSFMQEVSASSSSSER